MRRKSDLELQKVTLNLFAGEFGKLQDLYPKLGAGVVVRNLVHSHLRQVEEKVAQLSKPVTPLDLPLDLDEVLDKVTEL